MPTYLVIGGDGLLGQAIVGHLKSAGHDVVYSSRRTPAPRDAVFLDLGVPDLSLSTQPWFDQPVDRQLILFLTAGMTGFAQCEQDQQTSRLVNVINTTRIASEILKSGGTVLYPSSSAVFGHHRTAPRESTPPDPVTEYGRHKAMAEQAIMALSRSNGSRVVICRLSKVLSGRAGIVHDWIAKLRGGQVVHAAGNLGVAPLSADFTARQLVQLADQAGTGIYHLSGENEVSYLEVCLQLCDALGVPRNMVVRRDVPPSHTAAPALLDMTITSRQTGISAQELANTMADLVREQALVALTPSSA